MILWHTSPVKQAGLSSVTGTCVHLHVHRKYEVLKCKTDSSEEITRNVETMREKQWFQSDPDTLNNTELILK